MVPEKQPADVSDTAVGVICYLLCRYNAMKNEAYNLRLTTQQIIEYVKPIRQALQIVKKANGLV